MRMGPRLAYSADLPQELASHPFPPNMLISLVENAIRHGVEPAVDGGTIAINARRDGERIVVGVRDSGRGLAATARANGDTSGHGVGLAKMSANGSSRCSVRVASSIEDGARGTRAIIAVPYQA